MNDTNYKELLYKHIAESTLDDKAKFMWDLFSHVSTPEEDEAIYEAITDSDTEENLFLLTKNLKDKIWAMQEGTPEAWDKVIEEERAMLENL